MSARALGDSLLTGSNEVGLAFGEALAPDGDGFAKPTAVRATAGTRSRRVFAMRREAPRPHVYFVGQGAEQFAHSHGMPLIDNSELVLDRECARLAEAQSRHAAGLADNTFSGKDVLLAHHLRDDKSPETAYPQTPELPTSLRTNHPLHPNFDSHDTVGAVALDSRGNLAAATSTGGTLNKTPGRVGDSSLIGCGCYADNLSAAVSLTGWGEPIMKLVLGKWATDRVMNGTPPDLAAQEAIEYLYNRLGGHGGIILLSPDGRFGLAHNTPGMAYGLATPAGMRTGTKL